MFKHLKKTMAAAVLLSLSTITNAAIITGSVPADYGVPTFGGSGIPNDQISYMTFNNGAYLLGIAITPRFSSPDVTNSGNNYFAETGISASAPDRSKWNFSIFAAANSTMGFASLLEAGLTRLLFMYDMDSSSGTDFGTWDLSASLGLTPVIETSQNLSFNFLSVDGTDIFGNSITAPTGGSVFNPFASGNYEFKWVANGTDEVSANVSVPEPGTLAIFLLSAFGLISVRTLRK